MTSPPTPFSRLLRALDLEPAGKDRFRVERLRDGRSFHARGVVGSQDGEPIVTMLASFTHGG